MMGALFASGMAEAQNAPQSAGRDGGGAELNRKGGHGSGAGQQRALSELPVTRVLLYKSGVGFFEHAGTVSGDQRVTIDFTSAQLNDVLQSLTAIDLGGGRVMGADYGSATPLEQQLKTLPLSLGAGASVDQLYGALRGARVEVRAGGRVLTGRLLDVEQRQTAAAEAGSAAVTAKRYVTVVSEAGAVETVELGSGAEVRLLDSVLHGGLEGYLQAMASAQGQGLRHLAIETDGAGKREFRVSYISEVPVWKATYRILFGSESETAGAAGAQTATLQGWAIVDNTVGTDWNHVQLSLIAGAPQSFLQPLSQPYYTRRPEIGLPEEAQLTPQTHESGEITDGPAPVVKAAPPRAETVGAIGGGILGGIGTGSGRGTGASLPINGRAMDTLAQSQAENVTVSNAPAPELEYEQAAAQSITPNTTATAFDDYFEYRLAQPITIPKNGSALVPILQAKVEAERVTLWSPGQPAALRALWLTNTSDLTLDRGSFSIVEDGRFGGEGLLEPVHPKEKRLLSYAADQAVRVSTDYQHDTRRIESVAIADGILLERRLEVAEQEYLVRNAAPEPRMVIVEQPRRKGWELDSEVKPVETTPGVYRFRVSTAPGETVRLHIGERHTVQARYQVAKFDENQMEVLLRSDGDDPKLREALEPVFAARRRVSALDQQVQGNQAAVSEIVKDQERLRANLAALKGSSEERALVRRYTGELNADEDRLGGLRRDGAALQAQRDAARKELEQTIVGVQLNEKLG